MPKNKNTPQLKKPERYEELRDHGMSKEKAARISNSQAAAEQGRRESPSRKGGKNPPYEDWTRDELYGRAKEIGIEGRSGMKKDELIKAIRSH